MGGCLKVIGYIIFFPFVVIYMIYKAIKKSKPTNSCAKIDYQHRAPIAGAMHGNTHFDLNINYEKQSKIVSIFTKKWSGVCRQEFVVLDFETTGLDKAFDRIVEIAAIRYMNGREVDKFVTLVNPQTPIPAEAQAVHHISNRMVANAPTEEVAIPQLIDFIGDSLLVGHNVNFDVGFLEIAAQRCGQIVKYNYIDTISVSKKLFSGLPNYKLGTIAQSMNFDTSKLHRAEADVRVCAEIMTVALDSLEAL